MRTCFAPAIAVATALTFMASTVTPAAACGGFFCNAVALSPIYQAGERILFVEQGDGLVTMHIEVSYSGDPTDFAWILPIPEAPRDAAGNALPLEEAVQVSSQRIFSTLQANTDPIFQVNQTYETVCAGGDGSGGGDLASTSEGGDGDDVGDGAAGPAVQVLEEAKVGPYDAQLIEADDADALFAWLNDNGYYQDPNAKSLLQHYMDIDFVFVGVKLASGKDNGDLRPLAITVSEGAPCVPLRLTSIAATPDMPILVWALGQGRAIPKNFIHAQVNDQALQFPGGTNYMEVVTEAVESIEGRAWVTEYARPASDLAGSFLFGGEQQTSLSGLNTLSELVTTLMGMGLWNDTDTQQLVRDHVSMPEGLMGYPYGECWSAIPWDGCVDNAHHTTTEEEFYSFLEYWAGLSANDRVDITVDVAALAMVIDDEVVRPLAELEAFMAQDGMTLTRFFTTIDPENMTRDPLFAFNPDLPTVERVHQVDGVVKSDDDCEPYMVATYPDGSKYTHECDDSCMFGFPTLLPVPDAPALLVAEVIDEVGLPVPFDPAQAGDIDGVLAGAYPGTPTLPDDFEVDEPVAPVNPTWPNPPAVEANSGCDAGQDGLPLVWGALALLGLAALRRRRVA